MHNQNCICPKCQISGELEWEDSEFLDLGEAYDVIASESPFSEAEEIELAAELLAISSEEELDLFLGKLFKKAWKGIKKVGRSVGKIVRPLGRILKKVAKTALPFVGGALGSLIPIPGVGTAIGSAVGGALGKALEAELAGLSPDEQDLEMARRFVRLAGNAAKQAAVDLPYGDPQTVAETAVMNVACRHVPNLHHKKQHDGRWIRRGSRLILQGL
jgi:uncharacterized protein (DUF697 family)